MQKHTKIYMEHFSYGEQDFVPCESCGNRCIDVHHLDGRGPGKDVIENLMGLCRKEHDKAGASPSYNEQLREKHLIFLNNFGS